MLPFRTTLNRASPSLTVSLQAANTNSAVLPEEREPEPTATIADRRFPTGKQLKRTPVIVGDSREEETVRSVNAL